MLYLPQKESNEKGVEYQQKNNRFEKKLIRNCVQYNNKWFSTMKKLFFPCEMTLQICSCGCV